MGFGAGSRVIPALILTNLWTVALLFLAWNYSTRYEVEQCAGNISPEWVHLSEIGGDPLLPAHHRPRPNEASKGGVTVSQPVGPVRDQNLPAFCPECGEGDLLCAKYGLVSPFARYIATWPPSANTSLPLSKFTIARSVAYGGASARLLRVLKNAGEGKSTKIGVLGGSVSCGHGITPEENWIALFEKWWKTARQILHPHSFSLR
jgi:hypothetical protein